VKTRPKTFFLGLILLITISFGLSFCATVHISETKKITLKHGKVIVKEIGGVTFHTYMVQGMVSHIIETNNFLILQDTVRNGPHNEELKNYLESIGKTLNRIIISHGHDHHWVGLEMFPDVSIYANAETIKEIQEYGDQMLQKLKERKGEKLIPYKTAVVPQHVITPGEETIDGVLFRFIIPTQEFLSGFRYGERVLFTELPKQRAIIHHHLAYVGLHFPPPPIPDRIKMLKQLKAKKYNWVMAGHGIPLGHEFFDKAVAYYETAQKVIEESSDVKTAKKKLMTAYPNYEGESLLDLLLPFHFKNQ